MAVSDRAKAPRSSHSRTWSQSKASPQSKASGSSSPLPARRAARAALGRILDGGQYLDDAFTAALAAGSDLSPRDRAFARLLVATVLRRLGQLDAVINGALANPGKSLSPGVRHILRIGAAQALFLGTPPHAVVDTSVKLTAADRSPAVRHAKGLVNAVLRKVIDQGPAIVEAQDAARLNLPAWLWSSWEQRFGLEKTQAIAAALTAEPPLDITLKPSTDREKLIDALTAHRYDVVTSPSGGLRIQGAGAVDELPGYGQGDWWVQDAAAALPAQQIPVKPGDRVLDLCAAPGGKTAQLAAAGARVTAVDASAKRMDRLRENLTRLKLSADCVVTDGAAYAPAELFDHVLLDAPCTATGTLRRHPDVQWIKTPADVTAMAKEQANLLRAAARLVKPGGTLVYCVCSLELAEGLDQIRRFLAVTDSYTADGDPIQTDPSQNMDGFFIARLRRQA